MANLLDDARSAFAEMLSLVGVPITFKNETKQCMMTPLSGDQTQELQGFVDNIKARVRMMKEDAWEGLIERQSEIILDGQVLIFIAKVSHPRYPWIHLILGSGS